MSDPRKFLTPLSLILLLALTARGWGQNVYLVGDKAASLAELQTAKKLDPYFRKQWDAEVDFFQELTSIKQDKEFLDKLFR
jgi:hypothetical protein